MNQAEVWGAVSMKPRAMCPIIDVDDVSKVYALGGTSLRALDHVTLSVDSGEFVAIMGSSGSGKSTLMNIIGCLDRPTAGHYRLAGRDVSQLGRADLAEVRNQMLGFVFQNFNLLPRTNSTDNVELPLIYAGMPGRERAKRARDALTRVGLGDRLHHLPSQLSGGQQQRVAIARAIVNEPRILLADEPTGNLDTTTSEAVMGLFQELWRTGLTIVYVTHEADVARYASRVVVLRDGRIQSDVRQEARHSSSQSSRATTATRGHLVAPQYNARSRAVTCISRCVQWVRLVRDRESTASSPPVECLGISIPVSP
jgi:putative ABC transport system ATP-binding protein